MVSNAYDKTLSNRPLNVIFFTHEFFIQVGNTFVKM